jgi:hypothetical protein
MPAAEHRTPAPDGSLRKNRQKSVDEFFMNIHSFAIHDAEFTV